MNCRKAIPYIMLTCVLCLIGPFSCWSQIEAGRFQLGTNFGFLIGTTEGNGPEGAVRLGAVTEYWFSSPLSIGGALGVYFDSDGDILMFATPQLNYYPDWCASEVLHLFGGFAFNFEAGSFLNLGWSTPIGLMVLTQNKRVAFSAQYPLFGFYVFDVGYSSTAQFRFGVNAGLEGRVSFSF